jgi:hypothetical protein
VPLIDLSESVDQILSTIPDDYSETLLSKLQNSRTQLASILNRFTDDYPAHLDIGHGWIPLVLDLDHKLSLLSPHYTISQIKEKFAGLRYYADFQPPPGLSGIDLFTAQDIFLDLIHYAEHKSFAICEICAAYGQRYTAQSGYHTIRCKNHFAL